MTKRVEGAMRGRPKGSTKDFLRDPDRYAVAFADALQASHMSERAALDLAAMLFHGDLVEPSELVGSKQPTIEGNVWIGFELRSKALTGGVKSKTSTLLKKRKRAVRPEDHHFLSIMKDVFQLYMSPSTPGYLRLAQLLVVLSESIGERSFVGKLFDLNP